jgi:hypothetical protein
MKWLMPQTRPKHFSLGFSCRISLHPNFLNGFKIDISQNVNFLSGCLKRGTKQTVPRHGAYSLAMILDRPIRHRTDLPW